MYACSVGVIFYLFIYLARTKTEPLLNAIFNTTRHQTHYATRIWVSMSLAVLLTFAPVLG